MTCTEPVCDRLVEAFDKTVVTSNQAAVASGLSRDRTALHVSALKLQTTECAKGSNIPENPSPRRATRAGLWLAFRQPAKPVLAGPGVKGERSESTGAQRGVLETQLGGHRDSVGEPKSRPREKWKTIMREQSSTAVRAFHDVPEAMALLSLSRAQIYELIPSPLRLPQLGLCLP
jgi:hypothetical protein